MDLSKKINLFEDVFKDLSEEAKMKFIVPLRLVSYEDLVKVVEFLKSLGIVITKPSQFKTLVNSTEEIKKKVQILEEIGAIDIYLEDPNRINKNVIDIYRRIKYCKQYGITYKKGNKYEEFLFSETAFNELINEPVPKKVEFSFIPDEEPPIVDNPDDNLIDLKNYMDFGSDISAIDNGINALKSAQGELNTTEPEKTTNFDSIRDQLNAQLADLDVINFDDINVEQYDTGMRRVA